MSITRTELIDHLSGMTVMEMVTLTRDLEETWGVSATPAPQIRAEEPTEPVEEKTEFDVVLDSYGEKKINVIKTLRQELTGLGLKEAKEMVESAPVTIKEATTKEEADELKAKIQEAGGKVTIK